uniref:Sulfotransferase family cytosolic 1B member 1 n=1 Tax=Lygus hesperus TaxID=30085 RepID=A0A0A9WLX9_LYGHE
MQMIHENRTAPKLAKILITRKMAEQLEILPLDEDVNQQLLEDHGGERTGWHVVGPKKYCFPSRYATEADKFFKIKTRNDDVWISTFPRSGTTLTQELVWMVMNDCDYEGAKRGLWERSPFVELCLLFHPETIEKFVRENEGNLERQKYILGMSTPVYEYMDYMPSPRVIKTHFPPSLLPLDLDENGVKVIYVARNPKDVVISYYHLLKLWRTSDYLNTFEHFINQFVNGHVPWGPFWSHVQEGWDKKHQDNYLFLFYEDIIKDMKGTIRTVAEFLNKPMNDEEVEKLADHLHISNFKNNPAVNFEDHREIGILNKSEQGFIRQGKLKYSHNT